MKLTILDWSDLAYTNGGDVAAYTRKDGRTVEICPCCAADVEDGPCASCDGVGHVVCRKCVRHCSCRSEVG